MDSEKFYFCQDCLKSFYTRKKLRQHYTTHHTVSDTSSSSSQATETCTICFKKFPTVALLNDHLSTHIRTCYYTCQKCPLDFLSAADLRRHSIKEHSVQFTFPCRKCKQTFTSVYLLNDHTITEHGRVSHGGSRPLDCRVCGLRFSTLYDVIDHIYGHVNRNYRGRKKVKVCGICGKKFSSSSVLRLHFRRQHMHRCKKCRVSFPTEASLARHAEKHQANVDSADTEIYNISSSDTDENTSNSAKTPNPLNVFAEVVGCVYRNDKELTGKSCSPVNSEECGRNDVLSAASASFAPIKEPKNQKRDARCPRRSSVDRKREEKSEKCDRRNKTVKLKRGSREQVTTLVRSNSLNISAELYDSAAADCGKEAENIDRTSQCLSSPRKQNKIALSGNRARKRRDKAPAAVRKRGKRVWNLPSASSIRASCDNPVPSAIQCKEEEEVCDQQNTQSEPAKPQLSKRVHDLVQTFLDRKPLDECFVPPLNSPLMDFQPLNAAHSCQSDVNCEYSEPHPVKRHLQILHFRCSICGLHSESLSLSTDHLFTHLNKPFQCQKCLKSFISSRRLNEHRLVHSDRKFFVCGVCSKPFKLAFQLKRHSSIHTSSRPLICDMCDKRYCTLIGLKNHILSHIVKQQIEYHNAAFASSNPYDDVYQSMMADFPLDLSKPSPSSSPPEPPFELLAPVVENCSEVFSHLFRSADLPRMQAGTLALKSVRLGCVDKQNSTATQPERHPLTLLVNQDPPVFDGWDKSKQLRDSLPAYTGAETCLSSTVTVSTAGEHSASEFQTAPIVMKSENSN